MIVEDEFGRKTIFEGEQLVCETTDSAHGTKPQWLEIDVWRTESGNFVVKRATKYRIRHRREDCERAEGYDLVTAAPGDTYPCPTCNRTGAVLDGGWAQSPRITVDVYETPKDLILGFSNEGRYNNLARSILAQVAERDDRVDAVWNTVVVP